jgi:hypothetical protein
VEYRLVAADAVDFRPVLVAQNGAGIDLPVHGAAKP